MSDKTSDTINRQAAIDTDGLDEEIRCEMCENPMHTNRGCDGNCRYDEKLYKKIIQILDKRILLCLVYMLLPQCADVGAGNLS